VSGIFSVKIEIKTTKKTCRDGGFNKRSTFLVFHGRVEKEFETLFKKLLG
jgi:hypothetical protein